MDCAEYQRMISRFIDHEMKAAGCAELFEHLATCESCRQFYDSIISLGVELEKVPAPTDERMAASWRPTRERAPLISEQTRIAPRPSTLAFVIVVIFVVGLLFSVNVTIEKPAELQTSSAGSQ